MTKAEIAQAFSGGNFEICFDYLTDQTIWNTPGEQYLTGRTEIELFCKKVSSYFDSVTTNFQQLSFIENECCVAINGTAEFIRDAKRIAFISSCDVYKFNNDNTLISIHSYCITERPDSK